jgi:hypothetical protein
MVPAESEPPRPRLETPTPTPHEEGPSKTQSGGEHDDRKGGASGQVDPPTPPAPDLEARRRELGMDPKRGYIAYEGVVGAEIEGRFGGFERDNSGAGEWISKDGPFKGKSFDLLGIPPEATRFHKADLKGFLPSLDAHMLKSVDLIALDTRNMTPDQLKTLNDHIDKNWAADKGRIIIL